MIFSKCNSKKPQKAQKATLEIIIRIGDNDVPFYRREVTTVEDAFKKANRIFEKN